MNTKYLSISILFCSLFLLAQNICAQQECDCPYPIIFVHGWNGSENSWKDFSEQIAPTWDSYPIQENLNISNFEYEGNVIYSHLNSVTPLGNFSNDVIFHDDLNFYVSYDNGVNNLVSINILPNKCIYAVSFNLREFEENKFGFEAAIGGLAFDQIAELNDSPSNQSAIYKQGYALNKIIDKVISITNKSKVILAGHSMGGLAIREYLQRPHWTSSHRVAKVVTVGTPHRGSNSLDGIDIVGNLFDLPFDVKSEAVRDLRYSYDLPGAPGIDFSAPYLYGGNESNANVNIPDFYNTDIDCDGTEGDIITPLNEIQTTAWDGTTFNSNIPLPVDCRYTYYVSNISSNASNPLGIPNYCPSNTGSYGCQGDGVVDDMRQWIYQGGNGSTSHFLNGMSVPTPHDNVDYRLSDRVTSENRIFHTNQTDSDYNYLVRCFDEPDYPFFAYEISPNTQYAGIPQIRADQVAATSNSPMSGNAADPFVDSDWYTFTTIGDLSSFTISVEHNSDFDTRVDFYLSNPGDYINPNSTSSLSEIRSSGDDTPIQFSTCEETNVVGPSEYYLRVTHNLGSNESEALEAWKNPYKFKINTNALSVNDIALDCSAGIENAILSYNLISTSLSANQLANFGVTITNTQNSQILEQGDLDSGINDFTSDFTGVTDLNFNVIDYSTGCSISESITFSSDCDPIGEGEGVISNIGDIDCNENTILVTIAGVANSLYYIGEIFSDCNNADPVEVLTDQNGDASVQVPFNYDGSGITSIALNSNTLDYSNIENLDSNIGIDISSCLISNDCANSNGTYSFGWPFGDLNFVLGCASGCGAHMAGDFHAQDWNFGGGNDDCGKNFYSPVSGVVVFADWTNSPVSYGQQIVISVDGYSDVAFKITHLNNISVNVCDKIEVGDLIGTVGNSGSNLDPSIGEFTCHAHVVVHENLNANAWSTLKQGGWLSSTDYAGEFNFDCEQTTFSSIHFGQQIVAGRAEEPYGFPLYFSSTATSATLTVTDLRVGGELVGGGNKTAIKGAGDLFYFTVLGSELTGTYQNNDPLYSIEFCTGNGDCYFSEEQVLFVGDAENTFADVGGSNELGDDAIKYINTGTYYGLFKGGVDPADNMLKFYPSNYLTRGQAAKMICDAAVRAGTIQYDITGEPFPDVLETHDFFPHITTLHNIEKNGEPLIKGFMDGLFYPDEILTYEQFSKILILSMDLENIVEPSLDCIGSFIPNYPYPFEYTDANDPLFPTDGTLIEFMDKFGSLISYADLDRASDLPQIDTREWEPIFNNIDYSTIFTDRKIAGSKAIERKDIAILLSKTFEFVLGNFSETCTASKGVNIFDGSLSDHTILGGKLNINSNNPQGLVSLDPIDECTSIYSDEVVEWDLDDISAEGSELIYFWESNGGTLELVTPGDFSHVKFTPPSVSSLTTFELYVWGGHELGKSAQKFAQIMVLPIVGECVEGEPDMDDPIFYNCPTEDYNFGVDPGSCQAFVNWSDPVAGDNCAIESVLQTQGPSSGSNLDIGTYQIQYTAIDTAGNSATCDFTVNVIDTETLQWLNCPSSPIVFGSNPDLCAVYANWPTPVATDNCDVIVTQTAGPLSGELLNVGSYIVEYTATNNAAPPESIVCEFQVIVNETQNPQLNCPQDVTVANDPGVCEAAVPNIQLEFAFDNCPYTVTWTSSPTDVTGTGTSVSDDASGAIFPVGVTTVTYTITENDDNGNGIAMSSCDIIVTVVDEEPPLIICPTDAVIGTSMGGIGDCEGEYAWNHPTPTDNCGVTIYTLTYTLPDGSSEGPINLLGMEGDQITRIFDLGLTSMLYHVEDTEGNITECTWTVLVEDDEDPMIFCEEVVATNVFTFDSPLNIEPNDITTATITVGPDMDITDINILSLIGTQPDMGELSVTLTSPQGTTVTLFDGLCAGTEDFDLSLDDDAATNTSTATCGPLGGGGVHMPVDAFAAFNGERSQGDWVLAFTNTYVGICGVLTDWQLQIIGNDNGPNGNRLQVVADPSTCNYMMSETDFNPRFTDNCDDPFILQNLITGPFDNTLQGSVFPLGETVVTWTVYDQAGNTNSCNLIVEVLDTEKPTFTNCPVPDIVQNAETGICGANVTFDVPAAVDNCGSVTVTQIDATGLNSGSVFPVGMTIMTWQAEDPSGNIEVCSLRVIVNDTQEPQFTCPDDVVENMDPWLCSAVVQNIAPTLVIDNCEDNISITYQIEYPIGSGNVFAGGVVNASGEEFYPGISQVTYKLHDQPLILITEVTHDIGITNGGMDPVPYTVLTTNDYVEITNLGPTTLNVSGLMVERLNVALPEVFTIPDNTIIGVGETLVIHFGNGTDDATNLFFNVPCAIDMSTSTATAYVMSFKGRVLDVVTVNGYNPVGQGTVATVAVDDWNGNIETMMGKGGVYREFSFDSHTQVDWAVADVCSPITIGTVNPELDIMSDNGTVSAFQSIEANEIICSFTVEVIDQELPYCGEFEEHNYDGASDLSVPNSIVGGSVFQSTITVADDFVIGDVDILNVLGSHPDVSELTFKLTSPEGTQLILFDGLCPGEADFDFGLDSDTLTSIIDADCAPLGGGEIFAPVNSLCAVNSAFYGESSLGEWTFEIADSVAINSGQLDNWNLRLWEIQPYSQMDTIYGNEIGLCGNDFTWVHPRIIDNCKEGTVQLKYLTSDDINIPSTPGIIIQADTLTEFFEVGITTVRYILTDGAGNIDSCEFDVTILDIENPFVLCPANINIALEGGECRAQVCYEPMLTSDNCAVIDTVYSIEPCTYFEIGVTPVTIYVYDPAGNVDSCTFNVNVVEYVPSSESLTCNNHINLSLDENCEAYIGADMLLEGDDYHCYEDYIVILIDEYEDTIFTAPLIDQSYEGQTLTYTVIDPETGNSCWGTILVEEKLIPEIECPADATISCTADKDARDEFGQLITGELIQLSCELNTEINYEDQVTTFDDCSDPIRNIQRTFYLSDDDGHTVSCTQSIDVMPFDFTQIEWPLDVMLDCKEVSDNPILQEPDSTGYPMVAGVLINDVNSLCDLSHSYTEEQFWNCGNSYDILRTWKIRNRCLPIGINNPIQYTQVIEVEDQMDPIIVPCPDDITLSVDPWTCSGSTYLPLPTKLEDTCSDFEFSAEIYGSGFLDITGNLVDNNLQMFAHNINKGANTVIRYKIEDDCGNISFCSFNIHVFDSTPPSVIAIEDIIVNLTGNGLPDINGVSSTTAKLFASSVDNGSWDSCSDVKIEIAREADACDIDGNDTFNADGHPGDGSANPNASNYDPDGGEFVKFCCADIDQIDPVTGVEFGLVSVRMRVFDDGNMTGLFGDFVDNNGDGDVLDVGEYDNYNETWVTVRVEGKLISSIACPPDITLSCEMDYTDPNLIGMATTLSLCGDESVVTTFTPQLNSCGLGFVIATYGIEGDNSITCSQRITIENQNPPFDPSTIVFPRDLPVSPTGQITCLDQIDFDAPTWVAGPCDFIGYSEQVDTFFLEVDPDTGSPSDACFKILRTFTVFDWCLYDATNGAQGEYSGSQTIKITDQEAPVILNCESSMYEVDENCLLSGVTLTNSAEDSGDCASDWLKWQVLVDTWADGVIDYEYSSFLPTNDSNINNDTNTNGINDKYLAPTQSNEDVSVVIPEEMEASDFNHIVYWKVTDGCGNVSSCETTFMVVDKKAPTPYCVSISSSPMENGQVELWAIDFDLGAFDNCTDQEELRFTFSEVLPENDSSYDTDLRSSSQVFSTCGLQGVKVYVFDEVGNYDFCTVSLTLGGDGCEGLNIAGRTATELGDGVSNSLVTLDAPIAEYPRSAFTDIDGGYAFLSNLENVNYELSVLKDDNHTNGVSTLDLVLIQRHIIGFADLNSPYKVIAGDINNDEKVSSIDVVELRKVILGIQEEFENNTSWRFVDGKQVFADSSSPWPVDETRSISGLSSDMEEEDFVAVKVGDVNATAIHNVNGATTDIRSGTTMLLEFNDRAVKVGEQVEIAISSADFKAVSGLQMTIEFNGLTFNDVVGKAISVGANNVGVISDNVITMSWNTNTAISTREDLFVITALATKEGMVSEMINVTDRVITPEVYKESSLEIQNVELGIRGGNGVAVTNALMQNEPNPFKELTTISFHLATAGKATLTIRDVAGKVIRIVRGEYSAGVNIISLGKSDLNVGGLLYYTLESGDFSKTRKMIVIE